MDHDEVVEEGERRLRVALANARVGYVVIATLLLLFGLIILTGVVAAQSGGGYAIAAFVVTLLTTAVAWQLMGRLEALMDAANSRSVATRQEHHLTINP